jgi:probable rRNA maturation factor
MAANARIVVARELRGQIAPDLVRGLARRVERLAPFMGIAADELATLGIRLVANREMAKLHWTFMRERGATDVLSFPGVAALEGFGLLDCCPCGDVTCDQAVEHQSEHGSFSDCERGHGDNTDEEDDLWMSAGVSSGFGDLALCWPVVQKQAVSSSREAQLHAATILLVHGCAHLLGHDHRTRREARAMHRLESATLRRLGLADVARPYVR